MKPKPINIDCVVPCRNANGEPDFKMVRVTCTKDQYELGEHYHAARNRVDDEDGYEADPGTVVFDRNDGPRFLFANLVEPTFHADITKEDEPGG